MFKIKLSNDNKAVQQEIIKKFGNSSFMSLMFKKEVLSSLNFAKCSVEAGVKRFGLSI